MKLKKFLASTMAVTLCSMMLISGNGSWAQAETAYAAQANTSSSEKNEDDSVAYHTVTVGDTNGGKIKMDDVDNTVLVSGSSIILKISYDDKYILSKLEIKDADGNDIPYTDEDGKNISLDSAPEKVMFTMPDTDVQVNAEFKSTEKRSFSSLDEISETANVSEDEIMEYLKANIPMAVRMNSYGIAMTSAFSKNMTLTKNKSVFTCVNPGGVASGESFISLTDSAGVSQWAFCFEPNKTIGVDASIPGYSEYDGSDPLLWLKNNYDWNYADVVKLTRAVKIAAALYSHHGYCSYALRQNVIWHYVADHNSKGIGKYYILCDGQKGSYTCSEGHMTTTASVDSAVAYVWQVEADYEKLPSYNASQIYATAGQTKFVADTYNVAGFFKEFKVTGSDKVTVSNGYDGTYNGISISSTADCAGKTVWIRYTKSEYSYGGTSFTNNTNNDYNQLKYDGADAMSIYTCTGKQTVSIINTPISRVKGYVKVTFAGGGKSLNAKYSAKDKVTPAMDLYIEKTDADTGEALEGAKFDIYMDDSKVASVTTDSYGTAVYHWRGSEIWTEEYSSSKTVSSLSNWSTEYLNAKKEVLDNISEELENIKANTKHKWKVEETQAPDGYEINTEVWEAEYDLTTQAIKVSYTDEPRTGYVTLKKSSGNTSITKDNDCYSLKGAEYGIYASENDAKNDTNRKATLTTDENGDTNTEMIGAGTWYIKEVKAGKGYLLCDGSIDKAANGIHQIEVTTDNTEDDPYIVKCTDPVGNDPFVLQLHKMDYDTGEASAVGDAGLQGAIFELDYYTNTDGKTTGTPTRKWYFKTNEKGILFCSNESYLVSNYTMNNGTVLKSDSLFKDTDTGNVIYPIGSYRIKEVVPPLDYQNVGTMNYVEDKTGRTDVTTGLVAIIKQDSNGENPHIYDGNKKIQGNITASNLAINIYDKVYKGSISVVKKDANDNTTPIAGAKYKLVGQTDGKTYTGTTDANGKVSWSNLIPQNYTLTELSTPDGYSLLKDNVNVKIPMELTLDEINKSGADIKKSVFDETSQMYCFYDLSYTIGESVTPPFPSTGADQHLLFLLLIGALAVTGTGAILFMKKSKKHDEDELPRGIFSK